MLPMLNHLLKLTIFFLISCQTTIGNAPSINPSRASIKADIQHPALTSYENQDPKQLIQAKDLWWLNDQSLQITRAWNFSSGYDIQNNRPIRIAVIDSGFAGLINAIKSGGDLEGQVLWQDGRKITFQPHVPRLDTRWTQELLELEEQEIVQHLDHPPHSILINVLKSHGTKSISSIVSRMNDGKGTVGVAPHAQAIPYKVGNGTHHNWEEVTQALVRIAELPADKKIDVINMSLWDGRPIEFMRGWTAKHQAFKWYPKMKEVVDKLTANGTIIVSSAGNGSWKVDHNFPAGLRDQNGQSLFPNIISVGAIEPNKQRAIFKESPNRRQHGSNWGDNIDIWAPGKDMIATGAGQLIFFDVRLNKKRLHLSGEVVEWGGTSAASPLVAGVVALIKARKPDIQTATVKSLLKQYAVTSHYIDKKLRKNPTLANSDIESECGTLAETLHCGELFSKPVSLKIANAYSVLKNLLTEEHTLKIWQGKLLKDDQFQSDAKERFQLQMGVSHQINDRFAITNSSEYVLIDSLIKNQSVVSIWGWKIPNTNRLNVLQIKAE